MPFQHFDHIAASEPVPGFHGRFVHSDTMTLAYWHIDEGATLPSHEHPHEQICWVLEGELELTVGNKRQTMGPGSVAEIAPHVPHAGRAKTACRVVDVFHPVREDYQ